MLKILRIAHVCGWLAMGSVVWISSTGFSETATKESHEASPDGTPKATAEPKAKGAEPKAVADAASRRQAALDKMKQQLRKVSNGSLRQFTGQLAQFQKVNPDILNGIVEKLPDVNEEQTKALKDAFKESFPLLGDTADADLNRVVAELLLERFNPTDPKDGKTDPKNDGKTDDQKVREEIDRALAALADKDKKGKEDGKNALDDFNKNLNRQLDDLFKASQLAKNNDDKNKNNLGDLLPNDLGQQDNNTSPPDSGSGSGSGGGSPSGGDKKGGNEKSADNGKKDKSSDKKTDSSPLNLTSNKSPAAETKPTKADDSFSLDIPKKDTADKPPTIKTGATTQPPATPADTSLMDPSSGGVAPRERPQIAGSFSPGAPISPASGGGFEGGGGTGAGIQIASASASPLSSGDGDIGQGLGNPAAQPYEERGRFYYQRTSDKDWVSSGGTNEEGYSGGDAGGGNESAYGRGPASTLASLGISSPRETSGGGNATEGRGVFAVGSLKKLCKSSAGSAVGVCSTRAASQTATTARAARGSLYEKARASGAIRMN